jgi:glycosyltransferase involved in cell wall biosynthesis
MDIPKVTVCVITYNQARYIRLCLESIVEQRTNFSFEVIVGDDCSTDGTAEIIQEFALRYPEIVRPILRKRNIGGHRNYIDTHNFANGKYVCHCDGDDRCLPGKLQIQADFLDANSDFTAVWSKVNLFNDAGRFYSGDKTDYTMFENGVLTFSQALRLGSVGVHSTIMYRASARKTKNPSFETLDMFYTWELLSQGKGKILDLVLGEYRVHTENSLSTSSALKIRALNASHAQYFLKAHPLQRKDIFVFSLFNMLVDLKNRRSTWLGFWLLAIRAFSFRGLFEFSQHVKVARQLKVPDIFRD